MKNTISCVILGIALVLTACTQESQINSEVDISNNNEVSGVADISVIESDSIENLNVKASSDISIAKDAEIEETTMEVLKFVDVFGEEYETVIKDDVPKHVYQKDSFRTEDNILS